RARDACVVSTRTAGLLRERRRCRLANSLRLTGGRSVPDVTTLVLLSVAVFAGAFVSGLSGFAFSAVAGAILLHVFPPMEAVPLMMACSITVQAANLFALRKSMQWKTSLVFIAGGLLGIPIAIYLLQNADTGIFRLGFGILVSLYAAYALFRPAPADLREMA